MNPSELERMLTVSLKWTSHLHKEHGSRPTRTSILTFWRAARLTVQRYQYHEGIDLGPAYLYPEGVDGGAPCGAERLQLFLLIYWNL